jgi:hypothetical protein
MELFNPAYQEITKHIIICRIVASSRNSEIFTEIMKTCKVKKTRVSLIYFMKIMYNFLCFSGVPVGGANYTQLWVKCSDNNVICTSRKVQQGEPHDIFLKVSAIRKVQQMAPHNLYPMWCIYLYICGSNLHDLVLC